ncbi:saccharopine dehydrogenase C-terminal domain-containing protein [Aliikangiella sp. IMCC44653]
MNKQKVKRVDMSNILLLGAGFVTGPLVEHLHAKQHHITIGSQFLHEAEKLAANRERITPLAVDVTSEAELRELIKVADIVISFVPYQFHVSVAKICISEKKSMVTASYTHQDMWALDPLAKQAGITILNEIGVDPGVDHMTAMKVIDEAHDKGQKVEALVSWCGGLPAPEASNNPLGYKFSWSPLGVLMALNNDAQYLSQGEISKIPSKDLLSSKRDVYFSESLQLQGYANRDSVSYRESYRIPEVKTLLRGTLRYPGFCPIIDQAKALGLLSQAPFQEARPTHWLALIANLNQVATDKIDGLFQNAEMQQHFEWLGCLSELEITGNSPMEAFSHLLSEKLKYAEGEQDMIAMQHRMLLVSETGERIMHRSTLVETGDVGGFSAMAKTVGYPAAIAADLILKGVIDRKGVCIPVTKDIYLPVLAELEAKNIVMHDEVIQGQDEASFLNNL